MNKIKVLYEGLSSNIGGIENYVYNLCKNMDMNLFDVSILLDYGVTFPFAGELEKIGCKFVYITNRKKSYKKYLSELRELYSHNDFDIIHINVMSYSIFERITYACKYSNAKVIVHSHSTGYNKGYYRTKILSFIGKLMTRKCDTINVACGKQAGEFMFGNKPFVVFNNGIDLDKFKFNNESRQQIRNELSIGEDDLVIGLVAAFFPVKNHDFLIDIFEEMIKKSNNLKLVLVGEGLLQDEIKRKVDSLGLSDKVFFLGKRLDTNRVYSAFDLYTMPSLNEGLSISLVEAQVNGLKCYTSTNVDQSSNITGNVEFLSLDQTAKYWADYVLNSDNSRDKNVLEKVPDEFNAKNSYAKVYQFYIDNL